MIYSGRKIVFIPGDAVRVTHPAAAAAIIPWYLAGGISAANCIAAYQPKGAADYAASKVNLANPGTYNAANGTAYPTWDVTDGWRFSAASSQWLETGITPVNNQQWSGIVKFTNFSNDATAGCFFGLVQSVRFAITQGGAPYVYQNGSYLDFGTGAITTGNFAVAGNKGYKNGSADTGTIPTASGSFSDTIAIGQTKEAGYLFYLSAYIQALAIYDTVLTSTQVGLLVTAMAAL